MRACILAAALAATLALSCSTQRKLNQIKSGELRTDLSLPAASAPRSIDLLPEDTRRDTLRVVDFEGRETLIMNAIRDEDGEMTATDRLTAAMVTARFRNVAERHGRVDLEFQVRVPAGMQDGRWQLRLDPDLYMLSDSVRLEPVIITGRDYRKAQLRGYEQYRRFLNSIITDSTKFINKGALEIFLQRNLPMVYDFRCDSSFVSDEDFSSAYGVTEQEAVEHYTAKLLKRWNKRRAKMAPAMFRRYVKSPIVTEGIRLDTVLVAGNGDFVYNYVQTIRTSPALRKADIVLSGGIWEQDNKLYDIPRSEALSFYISSLSGLTDNTERYRQKVIERCVFANTACYIEFPQGRWDIVPELGDNPQELGRIKENIRGLLDNEHFEMDSISVEAFASPEGALAANDRLCRKRAQSASEFFAAYAAAYRDSVQREAGVFLGLGGAEAARSTQQEIAVQGRSGGENWKMLDVLVASDGSLSNLDKELYGEIASLENPDRREAALGGLESYHYIRQSLYPRLRVVKFNFYLHRRGMQRDTLVTTELDSCYMRGVQLLKNREYEQALLVLRPYADYNAALASVALDRNNSALEILQALPPGGKRDYLLALVYSRLGDERLAVQHYLHACAQEPSFVHRGNLDPEISELIRKYCLSLQPYGPA